MRLPWTEISGRESAFFSQKLNVRSSMFVGFDQKLNSFETQWIQRLHKTDGKKKNKTNFSKIQIIFFISIYLCQLRNRVKYNFYFNFFFSLKINQIFFSLFYFILYCLLPEWRIAKMNSIHSYCGSQNAFSQFFCFVLQSFFLLLSLKQILKTMCFYSCVSLSFRIVLLLFAQNVQFDQFKTHFLLVFRSHFPFLNVMNRIECINFFSVFF